MVHSQAMLMLLVFSMFISTNSALSCPDYGNTCGPCTGLSGNDDCILDCNEGRDDCNGYALTCSTGFPCITTCIGWDSCWKGTLNTNGATSLVLNCGIDSGNNEEDCGGLSVDASTSQDVVVHCTDPDGDACKDMILRCGTGNCEINCEGDSCYNVEVDATLSSQYTCSGGGCGQISSVVTSTPTTDHPTTSNPTTVTPTTATPTTMNPTTVMPTTGIPTTATPTTNIPTTRIPTTVMPTTNMPTSNMPTTNMPTTTIPTTMNPTTLFPTTNIPTTNIPTTSAPTTSTVAEQCNDRYNAMLSVMFDYQNTNNVALSVIRNILTNISNKFVTTISANISSNCVVDDYTETIDISHGANNAIINISMCLDCQVAVNTQDLFNEQKLQTDFIIIFKNGTNIIDVTENSTSINVDVTDREVEMQETTETAENTDNNDNNAEKNDGGTNELLGSLMYAGGGFIATCVLFTCCLVIYSKRQKKYKMNENSTTQNTFQSNDQLNASFNKMQSISSFSKNNSTDVNLTEMVKQNSDDYIMPGSPQTLDMGIETIENNAIGNTGEAMTLEGSVEYNDPSNDPIIDDDDGDVLAEVETMGYTIQ